jgi:uncharacterized SAM-binding protein YcdF (DUF218 family)
MVLLLATFTPVVGWWATALAGPWTDPAGDVLIVLGGAADNDGIMGQSSYLRSTYALMAYREGGFRHVVVSGAATDETPIAESMRRYLVCLGIPAAAIHVEPYARTTRENALFTKPILDRLPGRKVLLTSDYHMARAYRAFRKAGIDVEPRPLPDVLKRVGALEYRWGAFLDVSRETAALAYYFARRWI